MRTSKIGWLHLHCIEACIAAIVTLTDIKRSSSIHLEHRRTPLWLKALLVFTIGLLLNNNMLFLDNLVNQHPFPESPWENATATCIAALLLCYRRIWPFPIHLLLLSLASFLFYDGVKHIFVPTVIFESMCTSLYIWLEPTLSAWETTNLVASYIFMTISWVAVGIALKSESKKTTLPPRAHARTEAPRYQA